MASGSAASARSSPTSSATTRSRAAPSRSPSCGPGPGTATASWPGGSAPGTHPMARSRISSGPSPTSCGSRARATSNASADGRSLVRVEAAAGLAAVVAGPIALLDAPGGPVFLTPRRCVHGRSDHEGEVDAGQIHEPEGAERMAEGLLGGEIDLLEGRVALIDEEARL